MTQICLRHRTPTTGDKEHEPPQQPENELTLADAHEKHGLIRLLHETSLDTPSIHKALQTKGKVLARLGKQAVSERRTRLACICIRTKLPLSSTFLSSLQICRNTRSLELFVTPTSAIPRALMFSSTWRLALCWQVSCFYQPGA